MRSGSGMTVLTLVIVGLSQMAASAHEPRAPEATAANRVNLVVQIAGLGSEGCEIEVTPGHPGCRFEAVARTVEPVAAGAVVRLDTIAIEAQSTGADRDCTFRITIREPGRPPRSFLRGLRLANSAAKPQTLRCYLSTASLAARDAEERTRR